MLKSSNRSLWQREKERKSCKSNKNRTKAHSLVKILLNRIDHKQFKPDTRPSPSKTNKARLITISPAKTLQTKRDNITSRLLSRILKVTFYLLTSQDLLTSSSKT